MSEPDLSYYDNAVYRHAAEEARNERELYREKYNSLLKRHQDFTKKVCDERISTQISVTRVLDNVSYDRDQWKSKHNDIAFHVRELLKYSRIVENFASEYSTNINNSNKETIDKFSEQLSILKSLTQPES